MIGFIIFALGLISIHRLLPKSKISICGEYRKERIDLGQTRDCLMIDLSKTIENQNDRGNAIVNLIAAKNEEEKAIQNIKDNKHSLFTAAKSFKTRLYPITKSVLRPIKYIITAIPVVYALRYIDINYLNNSNGFSSVALGFLIVFLILSPLYVVAAFMDDLTTAHKSNTIDDFVVNECDSHLKRIASIEKQLEFEREGILDTQNKIEIIKSELAKRESINK